MSTQKMTDRKIRKLIFRMKREQVRLERVQADLLSQWEEAKYEWQKESLDAQIAQADQKWFKCNARRQLAKLELLERRKRSPEVYQGSADSNSTFIRGEMDRVYGEGIWNQIPDNLFRMIDNAIGAQDLMMIWTEMCGSLEDIIIPFDVDKFDDLDNVVTLHFHHQ